MPTDAIKINIGYIEVVPQTHLGCILNAFQHTVSLQLILPNLWEHRKLKFKFTSEQEIKKCNISWLLSAYLL